jgi:hypothetical protein
LEDDYNIELTRVQFLYIFSGENFGENSAKIFPLKMLGKIGIFRGKSFKKFFPKKFLGKFRGKSLSAEKNVRKIDPRLSFGAQWTLKVKEGSDIFCSYCLHIQCLQDGRR